MMDEDILTISEVAKYLRVSERTVYEWAQKGNLPAGKFGTVWRFKKQDIENWVNDRLSAGRTASSEVRSTLSQDRIVFLNTTTKRSALLALTENMSAAPHIKNPEELADGILKREEVFSSGLGGGIAIPHIRLDSVTDIVVSVGINALEINDFNSLDGQPVRILLMIAAAKNQHSFYLQTLSHFSTLLKNQSIFKALLNASTELEAYKILAE
jgi:PTS system nitrogen regulatory IIA component